MHPDGGTKVIAREELEAAYSGYALFARAEFKFDDRASDIRLTSGSEHAERPSLAWNGSEYLVGWYSNADVSTKEVYAMLLDGDGTPLTPDIRITEDDQWTYMPEVLWAGSQWGLLWPQAPDSGSTDRQIYYNTLDICP